MAKQLLVHESLAFKPSTDDKVNTVYNFAHIGKVQAFTAPYDGKCKVETWGSKWHRSGGSFYISSHNGCVVITPVGRNRMAQWRSAILATAMPA